MLGFGRIQLLSEGQNAIFKVTIYDISASPRENMLSPITLRGPSSFIIKKNPSSITVISFEPDLSVLNVSLYQPRASDLYIGLQEG